MAKPSILWSSHLSPLPWWQWPWTRRPSFRSLYSHPFTLFTETQEVLDWTIAIATTLSLCFLSHSSPIWELNSTVNPTVIFKEVTKLLEEYQRLAASQQHSWFCNLLFVFYPLFCYYPRHIKPRLVLCLQDFLYTYDSILIKLLLFTQKNHCVFSIQARLIENN